MRILLTTSGLLLLASTALAQTASAPAESAVAATSSPCGTKSIQRCVSDDPQAARRQIEAELKQTPDVYKQRLLGDLYASDAPFADKARAKELYEAAYEKGDVWAGVGLAKLLAAEEDDAARGRAITILEAVADKSDEAGKWTLYDAAVLRLERAEAGDEKAAFADHARAAELSNPWSMVALAHRLADGRPAPIEAEALAEWMEAELEQKNPLYLLHGRNALARLYLEDGPDGKRTRALELLREVGERQDAEGQKARVTLARHLLKGGDAAEQDEGLAILQREAATGFGPAEFELGRHWAELEGDKQDADAERLLRSALSKDASQAAYGYYLIGELDWADPDLDGKKRALESYELAAEAGNAWAEMRLSQAYASGAAGQKSSKLARLHGERAFETDNPQAGVAALFALYDTPYDLTASEMIDYVREALEKASAEALSDAISWSPDNSRVRFAQALWKERELYEGPVNGILNASTMKVFARECRRYEVTACRSKIMPRELVLALVSSLEPSS